MKNIGKILDEWNGRLLDFGMYLEIYYSSNDGCLKYYLMKGEGETIGSSHNSQDFQHLCEIYLKKEGKKQWNKEELFGMKIKCVFMNDSIHPIPSGTIGTILNIDDMEQIHVSWENGSGVPINLEVDECEILDGEEGWVKLEYISTI